MIKPQFFHQSKDGFMFCACHLTELPHFSENQNPLTRIGSSKTLDRLSHTCRVGVISIQKNPVSLPGNNLGSVVCGFVPGQHLNHLFHSRFKISSHGKRVEKISNVVLSPQRRCKTISLSTQYGIKF